MAPSPSRAAVLVMIMVIIMSCRGIKADLFRFLKDDHRFKAGDSVPLYSNKVGPFHNPSETYRYFDLPFCLPDDVKEKREALGEVLNGDRLVSAPYVLDFLMDKESEVVCRKRLTKKEVAQFRSAVDKDYYFQMYYDDLPIWGFIGKVDREGKVVPSDYRYYLYKHIQFDVLYNNDHVIEVNARMDPHSVIDLTEDKEVDAEFTYSVKWKETDMAFEHRMDKFSQASSLPHHLEIHWFSIINSCVTVLLLTGFLATILMRVLKNDFVKYARDEESADDQEETGWKYIHGDVFRFPKHKSLFAAAVGSGTQLFALTVFIFILALVGVFYPYNRGALFTALVVMYALTSGFAGYTSASFYCQLDGTNWNPKENSRDGLDLEAARKDSMKSVEKYLQLPIRDMILDKLKTVEITGMVGSRALLRFIKLMLVSSLSLEIMKLGYSSTIDENVRLRISRELFQFNRCASTSVKLIM